MANMRLSNGVSRLHDSRFTTTYGNVALRGATRRKKKTSTMRGGAVDRRNWFWPVGGDTGPCDPKYMGIGCKTG